MSSSLFVKLLLVAPLAVSAGAAKHARIHPHVPQTSLPHSPEVSLSHANKFEGCRATPTPSWSRSLVSDAKHPSSLASEQRSSAHSEAFTVAQCPDDSVALFVPKSSGNVDASCCPIGKKSCTGCAHFDLQTSTCKECQHGLTALCLQQFADGEAHDCTSTSVCLNCVDVTGWTDRHGRGCAEVCPATPKIFSENEIKQFREDEASGVAAHEACCACGGGTKSPSAWAYMGRAEVLFGDSVRLWPQPRTASHYVPAPECDLSSYGLTLDSVTGEISGTVERSGNETEAVSVSCPVMAVQSTEEGLTFNATATLRIAPFSFGSAALFLEDDDPNPPEVHTRLSYQSGSLKFACTPSLPWIDTDALKTGKLKVKAQGRKVGGTAGGIDGIEAAEAAVGDLPDPDNEAGSASAGTPLDSLMSGRCTATYSRIVKTVPGGTAETVEDTIDVLLVRYRKWKAISYPDLPTPNTLRLVAGQTLPPSGRELLPENSEFPQNRNTYFRASKPAYFTVACGIPGLDGDAAGKTTHNIHTGEVRFASANGTADLRLFDLNAHSGLISGFTGFVQGNLNDLNPKWHTEARRYVVNLQCRIFGRDMAHALLELKGGSHSAAASEEWIVSAPLSLEISDAWCWQDAFVRKSRVTPSGERYDTHAEASTEDERRAVCMRWCVEGPTCALVGVEGSMCVQYRTHNSTEEEPMDHSPPCKKVSSDCLQVWTKMKDCTSENTCRELEVFGSASLSGTYCPIVRDLKTGLPLLATAGMTAEDTIYVEPYTAERDLEHVCSQGGFAWILRQANPGGDFVDKSTSDFQLSGRILACLPSDSTHGHSAKVIAQEYIDVAAVAAAQASPSPSPSPVSSLSSQHTRKGKEHRGGASVDVHSDLWDFKFVPRLCPNPDVIVASKYPPPADEDEANQEKEEKEEESPEGVGSAQLDLMVGGTGAFRFFDYASGEDLWVDPCDCIPDNLEGGISMPQADPAQTVQVPSGLNLLDPRTAPDVLISAKGDTCPLANVVSKDAMQNVMGESACSRTCRAKADCNFFFTGNSGGSQVCVMYSKCDTLITHVTRHTDQQPGTVGKLYGVPRTHACLVVNPEECHHATKRRKMATGTPADSQHTLSLQLWLSKALATMLPAAMQTSKTKGSELLQMMKKLHTHQTDAAKGIASVFARETEQERRMRDQLGLSELLESTEEKAVKREDDAIADEWRKAEPVRISSVRHSNETAHALFDQASSMMEDMKKKRAASEDKGKRPAGSSHDSSIHPHDHLTMPFDPSGKLDAASNASEMGAKMGAVFSFLEMGAYSVMGSSERAGELSEVSTSSVSSDGLRRYTKLERDFLSGQAKKDAQAFWMRVLDWGRREELSENRTLSDQQSISHSEEMHSSNAQQSRSLTVLEHGRLNEVLEGMHRFVRSSSLHQHQHKHHALAEAGGERENMPFGEQMGEFVEVMTGTWELLFLLPDTIMASKDFLGFVMTMMTVPSVFRTIFESLKSAPMMLSKRMMKIEKLFVDIYKLIDLLARGGMQMILADFGAKVDHAIVLVNENLATTYSQQFFEVRKIPANIKRSVETVLRVFELKLLATPIKERAIEALEGWSKFQTALVQSVASLRTLLEPFFDRANVDDFTGTMSRMKKSIESMNHVPASAIEFTQGLESLKDTGKELEAIFETMADVLQFFNRLLKFPEDPVKDVLYLLRWSDSVRVLADDMLEKHSDLYYAETPDVYDRAPASLPRVEYASGSKMRVTCREARYAMFLKNKQAGLKGLGFDITCVDGAWVNSDGNPALSEAECAAVVQVGTPELPKLKEASKEHLYFMNSLPVALYGETSTRDFHTLIPGGQLSDGMPEGSEATIVAGLIGHQGKASPPQMPITPTFLKIAKNSENFGLKNDIGRCLSSSHSLHFLRTRLSQGKACDFDEHPMESAEDLFDSTSFDEALLSAVEYDLHSGMADAYHADPGISASIFDAELGDVPSVVLELEGMEASSFLQTPRSRALRQLKLHEDSNAALPAFLLLSSQQQQQQSSNSKDPNSRGSLASLQTALAQTHIEGTRAHSTTGKGAKKLDHMRIAGLLQLRALHGRREFQNALVEMRSLQEKQTTKTDGGGFQMSMGARREIEKGALAEMPGSLVKRVLVAGGVPASVLSEHSGERVKLAFEEHLHVDLGGASVFDGIVEEIGSAVAELRNLQLTELNASAQNGVQKEVPYSPNKTLTASEHLDLGLALLCSLHQWTPGQWEGVKGHLNGRGEGEQRVRSTGVQLHGMVESLLEWAHEEGREKFVGSLSDCMRAEGGFVFLDSDVLFGSAEIDSRVFSNEQAGKEEEEKKDPLTLPLLRMEKVRSSGGIDRERLSVLITPANQMVAVGSQKSAARTVLKGLQNALARVTVKFDEATERVEDFMETFLGKWSGVLSEGLDLYGKSITKVEETFEKLKDMPFAKLSEDIVNNILQIMRSYDDLDN
uniref:Apple domain-containing protein n=1 Tax=Chromera velia CCMP2878 TaxID=1169474 RepID=A0A0G4FS49_9ALVE|eukprot:Cvel_18507.t1-p1 / transcript=Cvel_18507.t1 / gene=Cvel_18507 / organism=Chromera_velia_CCMP2878 / gene_product=hypothetical protein / transcript_product=hypothetical protein / location=Cvel_scaffold1537:11101-22161(-) / protein_length=2449 / sequence_SO=supercontig / SO=protein_coding / is_pseudo=false